MGVMSSAYRGRLRPRPAAQPPRCDNIHSPRRADLYVMGGAPITKECDGWRNHYKRAWVTGSPGATCGSAVTPATGCGCQISPMTPSAPGTSLTGRAFGPT